MIVWADGRLQPETSVRLGLFDRGFTLGDAVFETILVEAGRAQRVGDHLAGLKAAASALGLALPAGLDPATIATLGADLAAANGLCAARAALRLTVTRGEGLRGLAPPVAPQPRAFATLTPAPAPEGPAILREVNGVRRGQGPSSRFKTGAYIDNVAARIEADPADEALILTLDGKVSGAAAANLIWVSDGKLCTPDATCAIREGVARAAVLAAAAEVGLATAPGRYDLEALRGAEMVAITSALVGLRPVCRIEYTGGASIDYPPEHPRLEVLATAAGFTRVD